MNLFHSKDVGEEIVSLKHLWMNSGLFIYARFFEPSHTKSKFEGHCGLNTSKPSMFFIAEPGCFEELGRVDADYGCIIIIA